MAGLRLALALLFVWPATVAAQQKMIPEELALALLGVRFGPGMGTVQLIVGQLPPEFPEMRLPANARVLGGMSSGRGGMTAVVMVPGIASDVRPAIEQSLAQSGWTRRVTEQPTPTGFQQRGFASSALDNLPASYCRDSSSLMLSYTQADRTATNVRLDYYGSRRIGLCDADRSRVMGLGTQQLIPLLRAPEGARQGSSGTGGSGDVADSHAMLYTPLNAEDLLEHYGEQLRAAGWTAGTRAVVSGAAIETWQLTKDGRDYYGLLSVIEQPNAIRTLGFRVATERER